MIFLENGPEILDSEQLEEHPVWVLENMYASRWDSLDQVTLTEEQDEESRRRELAQQESGGTHQEPRNI
jgi:hypothetical protein